MARWTLPTPTQQQIKRAARYALLPDIAGRLGALQLGFPNVALWMAMLYASCGLLPPDHPYARGDSSVRFNIIQVFAAGAQHVRFRWRHLDQVIIFTGTLCAFILLLAQIAMLLIMVVTSTAFASEGSAIPFTDLFATPHPRTDIAFQLLDRVFAVPGMFGSSSDPAVLGGIDSFHQGLHALFGFYNTAMLTVGGVIVFYFLIVVALETAQTGSPFGQRFSSVYAPLRLCIAVLLLVPIGYTGPNASAEERGGLFAGGLNAAQFITLYAAKMGSGLATNAWGTFNELTRKGGMAVMGMNSNQMVAVPRAPDVSNLVRLMHLMLVCKAAYDTTYPGNITIEPHIVKMLSTEADGATRMVITGSTTFTQALTFAAGDRVTVRMGHGHDDRYKGQFGQVFPYCGEITLHIQSHTNEGSLAVQESHFNAIRNYLVSSARMNDARAMISRVMESYQIEQGRQSITLPNFTPVAGNGFDSDAMNDIRAQLQAAMIAAREQMIASDAFGLSEEHMKRGWAIAGIYTNAYASSTGPYLSAANSLPEMTRLPEIMQDVRERKRNSEIRFIGNDRFVPAFAGAAERGDDHFSPAFFQTSNFTQGEQERQIAFILGYAYSLLTAVDPNGEIGEPTSNLFREAIGMIFGTSALFAMRENQDVHPIAKLSALGRGIMEHTVMAMMGAMGISFGGGIVEAFNQNFGVGIEAIGGLMMTIAMIGLVAGFILFYIVPFLPFMYFLFAVMKWVQTIFEAMVGLPLWALAHLRIDGKGLPGQAAGNGYFLIMEIFLRPIMILFGMIAAFVIFASMVSIMDILFVTVTQDIHVGTRIDGAQNAADLADAHDLSDYLGYASDELNSFFFMIMYTIIMYIAGITCFKLVDQIPNGIMRWIGSSAKNAVNNVQDSAQFLDYTFIVPAMQTVQGAGQATQTFVQDLPTTALNAIGVNRPPPAPPPTQ